jgi:hypothetical protein
VYKGSTLLGKKNIIFCLQKITNQKRHCLILRQANSDFQLLHEEKLLSGSKLPKEKFFVPKMQNAAWRDAAN